LYSNFPPTSSRYSELTAAHYKVFVQALLEAAL